VAVEQFGSEAAIANVIDEMARDGALSGSRQARQPQRDAKTCGGQFQ
jgi:hypothetical protein